MRNNRSINRPLVIFEALVLALVILLTGVGSRLRADSGACSGQTINLPFTDVAGNPFFCAIAAAFFSGLTNGTSATTYSPAANVTREQMAAFVSRTLDQALQRGSRRAALDQFWTTLPHYDLGLGVTNLGNMPGPIKADGTDLWVADNLGNVHRVSASDGKLLGTWTGANSASSILCAMGLVFITGNTNPGKLYMLDPAAAPGPVITLSSLVGSLPRSIVFDGNRLWTANGGGSASIITPQSTLPWTVTNITGIGTLNNILYDGANVWVIEAGAPGSLKRLDANGTVVQTVTVGNGASGMVFDGKNIWVLNGTANSLSVVRAATGDVLATLSGNGLNSPKAAAFDGERILVTNQIGHSVSLWKATDLAPLGNFPTGAGTGPTGVCSDGQYFWITLKDTGQLARF